jgi:hypothetical protein
MLNPAMGNTHMHEMLRPPIIVTFYKLQKNFEESSHSDYSFRKKPCESLLGNKGLKVKGQRMLFEN